MRLSAWLLTIPAALALGGCSADRPPDELFGPSEDGVLVVDAVMIVGDLFPIVRLSRATSPDRIPDEGAGVRGATVVIREGLREIRYGESGVNRGEYVPIGIDLVRAETTYTLEVRTTGDELLTAATTTPERFQVHDWVLADEVTGEVRQRLLTFQEAGENVYTAPQNRMVYTDGLLEARFDRPDVPAFQVALFSLDLDSDYVIDPDFFDPEDFEDLDRVNGSPPLVGDGTLRLPWFAVFFEGRYKVKTFAVDTNWYDLLRSDRELASGGPGFGGNAGEDFQRPIFHVEGGIGLFGSASVDSIGFYVLPRP